MARIWVCRFSRTWECEMSSDGALAVRKTGSTRSRREGDERRVRLENWTTSRRMTAKREAMGVFAVDVVSLGVEDSVVNVEDTERDIERICLLEELKLRGWKVG